MSVLCFHNVSHEYAHHSAPVSALVDISLTVPSGSLVGIVGPSGSGKSTLLHAAGGMLVPSRGKILYDKRNISGESPGERARWRQEHVGFIFQFFFLLPYLSALENVEVPLVLRGDPRRQRRERAAEILTQLGLGDRLAHRPSELSGGETQRVALARALVSEPSLLVADEPTGNLDVATRSKALELIFEHCAKRSITLLLASHDVGVCDGLSWVLEMKGGVLRSEIRR